MLKWVYSNMVWFKMKLQQFSKWDSYSIKMQINNVFLSSSQTFQPSYKIFLKYIVLSLLRHEIFVLNLLTNYWEFPGGPMVRLHALTAEGLGSISGQGSKIPQAV